jgi:hypothetical protein
MEAISTRLSSPRFQRGLFWVAALVLAAGVIVFALRAFGNDNPSVAPAPGYHPNLPKPAAHLKNAQGVTVRSYTQLDPQVKSAIRTFIATAVARKDVEKSWAVVAPSMKAGYTYRQWKSAKELPIIPYPVANVDKLSHHLEYATTKEIVVEVGLWARAKLKQRAQPFWIGLVPVGKGAQKRWLVDYWMPRWSPPVPAA